MFRVCFHPEDSSDTSDPDDTPPNPNSTVKIVKKKSSPCSLFYLNVEGMVGPGELHALVQRLEAEGWTYGFFFLGEHWLPWDCDWDVLEWRVTVDDPQVFTRPWTLELPLTWDSEYDLYEYACHEGNYSVANSLRGARVKESAASMKEER